MSPAARKAAPAATAALAQPVPDALEVWLDDPTFGPLTHLGRLHRSGLKSVRFEYSLLWLKNPDEATRSGGGSSAQACPS